MPNGAKDLAGDLQICVIFLPYTLFALVFAMVIGFVLGFVFYNLAAQPGVKFSGLNLARLYNHRGQQTQIQNQIFKEKMTIDMTIDTTITICNQPIFTGIKHHIIEKVLVEATNNYPYGTEKKLINAGQVLTNITKLTNINSSDIFADTECLKSLKQKLFSEKTDFLTAK